MNEKDLYQKKIEAQLDEWKADLEKIRARASGAEADAALTLKKQAAEVESKIEGIRKQIAELANAGDDNWESIKARLDAAREAVKSSLGDTGSKSE